MIGQADSVTTVSPIRKKYRTYLGLIVESEEVANWIKMNKSSINTFATLILDQAMKSVNAKRGKLTEPIVHNMRCDIAKAVYSYASEFKGLSAILPLIKSESFRLASKWISRRIYARKVEARKMIDPTVKNLHGGKSKGEIHKKRKMGRFATKIEDMSDLANHTAIEDNFYRILTERSQRFKKVDLDQTTDSGFLETV